jgi:hypothetical protein
VSNSCSTVLLPTAAARESWLASAGTTVVSKSVFLIAPLICPAISDPPAAVYCRCAPWSLQGRSAVPNRGSIKVICTSGPVAGACEPNWPLAIAPKKSAGAMLPSIVHFAPATPWYSKVWTEGSEVSVGSAEHAAKSTTSEPEATA